MRKVILFLRTLAIALIVTATISGCTSIDNDALSARNAIRAGNFSDAVKYGTELTDSHYTVNLGYVEAGRANMLAGDFKTAESYFRKGVDSAIDRKEAQPKIKLGDVGNTAMSATITDDRTRNYYLPPYELNMALEYAILTEALNGKKEDSLVDARLACYVQDQLAQTYGADKAKADGGADDEEAREACDEICENQMDVLQCMMENSRNSWENPVLWWLTGVMFEADGELDQAQQSYRKALACQNENPLFKADVMRVEKGSHSPGKAKVVVLYEQGLIPQRVSVKIPIPAYTAMAIDIPTYGKESVPYEPSEVVVTIGTNNFKAIPSIDLRALAARDLSDQLPGIITRNVTRALVQAGAQAAANASGNDYAKIGVLVANAVVSAIRRADTRSWITLPDGQHIWENCDITPGDIQVNVGVDGRLITVPVSAAAGETILVWISDCETSYKTGVIKL